jgi:hypothetical protein
MAHYLDFDISHYLAVSLLVLSKIYHKILVSFEKVQNFKILDLVMAKVEKVNIADIYYNYNYN